MDKQRDIEMLLCGEDEEKEDQGGDSKDEMKDYLQNRTKVDSGPLACKRQELTDIPQPLLPRQCIPVLLHNHLRVGRRPERDLQLQ
ncbi:hypothetical protein SKAU_G00280440 [Synaphobranchus kaupii]|uniref:Uncharacterized protein n=1 Tax=Synaphobranchus kaupii TaxID=118154 RepID=A0A9Q1INZ1_SYNKA|nr:hypothetical protein SKAU_G00280440 [Synaphobranchus kaupii]